MDTHKRIGQILAGDANADRVGILVMVRSPKDGNHLERRQHQRAIDDDMIRVALIYGQKHFNKGAALFTLHDRALQGTPYAPLTDFLRGLTVVCQTEPPDPRILTVYWNRKIARRSSKKARRDRDGDWTGISFLPSQ